MKGSVHYNKKSKRWVISVYWEEKRYRFWRHPNTGEPFWAKKSAEKQLNRIRTEVDEGYFNPKHWKIGSPLLVKTYSLDWLDGINVSLNTLKDYKSSVKKYIIPFLGEKDIRIIRYNDIVEFHKWIPRSDKGKYNVVSALKTMLRYAWRNEDLLKVPPFPELSYTLPEIEFITLEQQNTILSFVPERHRPIFQFMMEYGCRPGEVRAMQGDCIKDGQIHIRRAFSNNILCEKTKTGKTRRYPITSYIQEVLDNIPLHISPFLFVRDDGKPYTSKDLNKIWHEACEKAGIKIKLYNGVRHSLGCQLLDMGYDMDLVRQQLGHTKIEMTQRYAKRSNKILGEALESRRKNVVIFKKKVGE
ncbi:tyrosine-type recombinase/integrase [Candidatus Latescibacterota bacterium]